MDRLIYLAMSGAKATMQRQETLANNLANVGTTGFKKDRANFATLAYLYFPSNNRASQAAVFGDDPFPFGISKNRTMLETLFRNSNEEGLTQKRATIEEVFFPALLNT